MRKSRYVLTGVFLLIIQCFYASNPGEWKGGSGNIFLQNWTLNLNFGCTSYFGDLSQYDQYALQKLMFESKPAAGLKLTKYILPVFGITGQLIYGGLKSDYRPEYAFETSLLEYSLLASLDLWKLIFSKRSYPYGLEAYVGAGQFMFQSTVFMNVDGIQKPAPFKNGTPEFVYFFGGSLYYNLTHQFRITTDLAIRQAQNDNVDKYIAGDDFDYYSWFSVGITYLINTRVSVKRYRARNRVNDQLPVWR
jgi:hypothetical protein